MSSNLPNPDCDKCFGTGKRHNGYFSYPCDCSNPLVKITVSNNDFQDKKEENKMKLWLCSAYCDDWTPFGLHVAESEEKAKEIIEKELDEDGIWYSSVSAEEVVQVDGYGISLINYAGEIPKKPRID